MNELYDRSYRVRQGIDMQEFSVLLTGAGMEWCIDALQRGGFVGVTVDSTSEFYDKQLETVQWFDNCSYLEHAPEHERTDITRERKAKRRVLGRKAQLY